MSLMAQNKEFHYPDTRQHRRIKHMSDSEVLKSLATKKRGKNIRRKKNQPIQVDNNQENWD